MLNSELNRLLDRKPLPRLSDGLVHPVTVRHKLDASLTCLDFHVEQARTRPTVGA